MYGFEPQTSPGIGGLAASTPYADLYFPQAIGINSGSSGLVGSAGPSSGGNILPYTNIGDQVATGNMNASGTAATTPVSQQQPHWSSVLDFHNSVAPWILLAILFLYGWIHLSVRARGGPARFSGSV